MFLAIINDTYSEVKADFAVIPNQEFHITDLFRQVSECFCNYPLYETMRSSLEGNFYATSQAQSHKQPGHNHLRTPNSGCFTLNKRLTEKSFH